MINQPTDPLPALGRMMAFIDGENLVARYQAMLSTGRTPSTEVAHRRDVFVWSLGTIHPGLNVVHRATFYTYVVGSQEIALSAAAEIKELKFIQYSPHTLRGAGRLGDQLYPRVFWKQKNRSGKGVDIQMTIDALSNTYQNNLDTVYLVSGDGDYEPLIGECQRQGKRVIVAALSDGLSPRLPLVADQYINLDNYYFQHPADPGAA